MRKIFYRLVGLESEKMIKNSSPVVSNFFSIYHKIIFYVNCSLIHCNSFKFNFTSAN